MPKVTIKGKSTRKMAKEHKSVAPINKPKSKPKVAKANVKKPIAGM
jgi:hypothetical protein